MNIVQPYLQSNIDDVNENNMMIQVKMLINELNDYISNYTCYEKYINNTLITPFTNNLEIPTSTLYLYYRDYLKSNYEDFFPIEKYIFPIAQKSNSFIQHYTKIQSENKFQSLDLMIENQNPLSYLFSRIYYTLVLNDYLLTNCSACGKIMLINYKNHSTYCTRINTSKKLSCYDYFQKSKKRIKFYSKPFQKKYQNYKLRIDRCVKAGKIPKNNIYYTKLENLLEEYREQAHGINDTSQIEKLELEFEKKANEITQSILLRNIKKK